MKGAPTPATAATAGKLGAFVHAHWPYLLAALVAILLLALLVFLLVRRRRRKKAQGLAGESHAQPVPRLDLYAIRKAFVSRIPAEYRGALPLYRPVIVLGEAGCGKSALIDRCTDWQGQAAQFHPSHVEDPLLQIYHASRAVVEELSAVLLGDPSRRVRDALLRLWRPLRRGKQPRALVVLSAASVLHSPPEALLKQAQAIRGKLNILSSLLRRPVKTSLAITHMDQVEGFLELSGLLRDHGRPLVLDLGKLDRPLGAADLQAAFDEYEEFLPLVLTRRSAQEYLRALSFVRQGPGLLRQVGIFLQGLQVADPLTIEPEVTCLGLTSSKETGDGWWNPFAAVITEDEARRFRPQRRHQWAAAALGAAGVLYLLSAYLNQRAILAGAYQRLDAFLKAPSQPASRQNLFDYLDEEHHNLFYRLSPSFFDGHPRFVVHDIQEQFVAGIQSRILLPQLRRYEHDRDGTRALYLLALLYASPTNDLGKLVLKQSEQWEDTLGATHNLVSDYVQNNDSPASLALPIDGHAFAQRFTLPAVTELAAAPLLLDEINNACAKPFITSEYLKSLQSVAGAVLADLTGIERTRSLGRISTLLNQATRQSFGSELRGKLAAIPEIDTVAMRKLADLLANADLSYPDLKGLDLAGLLTAIEQIVVQPNQAAKELRVTLAGKPVLLSPADFVALTTRSRLTLLLQGFAAARGGDFAGIFFRDSSYPGLELALGSGSSAFFAGKAHVDGMFTEKAYDERVRPLLAKLPGLLKKTGIVEQERESFSQFLVSEIDDYAERYLASYRAYYRAFGYAVDSLPALQFVLNQLQLPSSPLRKLLADISRNTALTLVEENRFFDPLQRIPDSFAFVRSIVPKPSGAAPLLDKYVAILGQMQADLSGASGGGGGGAGGAGGGTGGAAAGGGAGAGGPGGGTGGAGGDDDGDSLNAKLTPVGRIALGIFRDQPDSYQNVVDKWLSGLNIAPEWRDPFSGLVGKAYLIGLRDMEKTVATVWDFLYQLHVQPLLASFPFKPDAESGATVAMLETALNPKKEFWTSFAGNIAPLCVRNRWGWDRRKSRLRQIDLPQDMLSVVSKMAELSDLLWDGQGQPKPLSMRLKPLPLPLMSAGRYVVVVDYLQVGEAGVFGFNQRPDWSEVKLEWWKTATSAAGAAFSLDGSGEKLYRSTSVQDTDWSFHRLLLLASEVDAKSGTYRWKVASPLDGVNVAVNFQLQGDPWALFRLR